MSETPNSLRSSATSRLVLALGEGEIRGLVDGAKSIYFGDTALQAEDGTYNFQGVTWETRPGTPDQEHMAGFPAIESDVAVSAEVTAANPITRTIVNPVASAVRVRIQLPQGLMNQNMGNGNLEASSVTLAIDVRPAGEAWTRKVEDTISGKTTSAYERAYRVELTGQGPWDVKVTRITADSDSAYLRNATSWTGYTEVVDRKCSYPYTALLGVAVDSQRFGSSVQKLSADIYGKIIQVPGNYDPETRAYTGIWDGTFKWVWSDNAAWCFYDMLRNDRFGLGLSSVAVDKWGLYECGRYSDELVPDGYGGMEPRFTCNLVLQTQEDAYQVISAMASIFRGMAYWATGSVVCAQDRPEDPTHLVTPAHVVGGSLSYAGTDLKSRHTVAYVTWSNPADGCKPDLEIVENAEGIRRYGWRPTDVVAVGCRSRGMARRVGEWITQTDLSETDTLVFTGGYYYADCMPGNILKVLDPEIVNVRHSGGVKAATLSQVVLDAPVELLAGEDYLLSVVLPDGLVADVAVATTPGQTDTLELATPLSAAPLPGALWVLTYAGAEARYFRVISNRETKPHLFEISAVERDPGKFARVEQGWAFDAPASSRMPAGALPAPTGLVVQEYVYAQGTTPAAGAMLSWDSPIDGRVTVAEIEVQRPGDTYVYEKSTNQCSLDVRNLVSGTHSFRVRFVSRLGQVGPWSEIAGVLLSTDPPPPDLITGLSASISSLGIAVVWTRDSIPWVIGYDFELDSTVLEQGYAGNSYTVPPCAATAHTIRVRARDLFEHVGEWASVSATPLAPAAPTVTLVIEGGQIRVSWTHNLRSFALASSEILHGDTLAGATSLGSGLTNTSIQFPGAAGSHKFWVRDTDVASNTGPAGMAELVISAPGQVAISPQVIDNNVLLAWTEAAGTLPVADCELRRGAAYAGSTLIGRISGRFATVFETVSGNYTYWITQRDVAGNDGTPSPITVQVSQPPDYVLQSDMASAFGGAKNNALLDGGALLMPVDTVSTVSQRMAAGGWANRQAKVDAGFPYRLEPTPAGGSYVEVIDYGTILAGTKITVTQTSQLIHGSVALSCNLKVRANATDAWTDLGNVWSAYGTNFRYVQLTITATPDGGSNDLLKLVELRVRLDVKFKNDAGAATCSASDSGGTQVNFNVAFVDVQSITLTPAAGGSARYALYDFTDAPNPTGFKILLYDASGNRVSGTCSWSAKGV